MSRVTPNQPSSNGSGVLGRWGAVAAYAGLIYYMSSLGRLPGAISAVPDKLGHGTLYALLGLLIARALTKPAGLSKISRGLLAVGLATLYGATDEWHQSFVPGRTAEWADVMADFLGAAAGVLGYLTLFGTTRGNRTHTRGR